MWPFCTRSCQRRKDRKQELAAAKEILGITYGVDTNASKYNMYSNIAGAGFNMVGSVAQSAIAAKTGGVGSYFSKNAGGTVASNMNASGETGIGGMSPMMLAGLALVAIFLLKK